MAPAQPTPEAPAPGTTTLYVLRDKLNGLYVDEHNLLNPLDLAQFWTTRELANAFRISGKRPDAEEVVPITLTVGDPC